MISDIQRTWLMVKFHERTSLFMKNLEINVQSYYPKNGRKKLELLSLSTLTSISSHTNSRICGGKKHFYSIDFCYPKCQHSFINPLKPNQLP